MAIAVERIQIPLRVALRKGVISWERLVQLMLVVGLLAAWEIAGRRLGDFFLAPPSSLWGATR
jgi:ABC-type nitrate/sulfonate/bicarbonate transport system permease component